MDRAWTVGDRVLGFTYTPNRHRYLDRYGKPLAMIEVAAGLD